MSLSCLMASGLDDLVFGRLDRLWVLVFFILAVACVVWGSSARRKALNGLGRFELVSRLVDTVHTSARRIRNVTAVVSVGLIGLGLLRLQYGGVAKVNAQSGLDIVLAVDYSKSMLVSDVFPSRSERLEAELQRFLDEAGKRGDNVGVVVFAGAARGFPLTSDMRMLRMFLDKVDPRTEHPGGTAIGKALNLSLQFLLDARMGLDETQSEATAATNAPEASLAAKKRGDQIIVLLTDGEDNASRPLEVAEQAAKLGIRIFTVGIGSTSGEPVVKYDARGNKVGFQKDEDGAFVVTRLDEKTLKQIASMTNASYVHIRPDAFGLDRVLEKMAGLSTAKREKSVEILREEGYAFFIVPAALLLLISLSLSERKTQGVQHAS